MYIIIFYYNMEYLLIEIFDWNDNYYFNNTNIKCIEYHLSRFNWV